MSTIREKLEQARLDLIDQGLRNPLINFRILRSRGIEVVDERSSDVYRLLVINGKSMDFLSDPSKDQPETIAIAAERPLEPKWINPCYKSVLTLLLLKYEFGNETEEDDTQLGQPESEVVDDPGRFTDLHLQTAYSSKELQRRLLETSDSARSHIEEQGVNILYMSLGEIIWYEDENSEIPHRAPLVLVPVELLRKSVDSRFVIKYTEGGVGGNIALRERLASDFRLQLPMPLEDNVDEQELDLAAYFEKVKAAVAFKKRWAVTPDAINVSFLSFGKFLMYRDLDDDVWPLDQNPTAHPILSSLLGNGFAESLRTELHTLNREEIDTYLSLNNNYHILDADSSQVQAIMAVKQGMTLAIQGPPGTGKSQTIANIIAELIGSGKTVLFVAEKLAALEVVKRRLDAVGIGDLCIELHSHKANKKALLEELQRTFKLGQPETLNYEERLKNFKETIEALNAYSEAVNSPVKQTGVTPFYAYGALLRLVEQLANITLPDWADKAVTKWTGEEYQHRLTLVEDLQRKIQRDGLPTEHAFWGSGIKATMPSTRDLIYRSTQSVLEKLDHVIELASQLADLLQLQKPTTLKDVDKLLEISAAIAELPSEASIDIASPEWLNSWSKITKVLNLGLEITKQASKYVHVIKAEIWSSDLSSIRQAIQRYGKSFLRGLNPSYRKATQTFAELCSIPLPSTVDQQIQLLDELINIQKLYDSLEQQHQFGEDLFGDLWEGHNSNWNRLAVIAQSIHTLQKAVLENHVPKQLLEQRNYSHQTGKIRELQATLVSAVKELDDSKERLFEVVQFSEGVRFGENGCRQSSFTDLRHMFNQWLQRTDSIQAMALFNISEEHLAAVGLREFYKRTAEWQDAPLHLADLFKRNWFEQIISAAIQERQPLQVFDSLTHEERLRKFREMDQLLLERNRQTIVLQHYDGLAKNSSSAGQIRILREEFDKKRRHKPIRKLISEAYNAIQSLKPVFMMSPMSVATFLEPGTIQFDVVIFDEASQIRPADAFGSIIRGKQVVVVGDNKQMPPTSFFDTLTLSDDESDDTKTSDYESILGLFTSRGVKDQMLRWHYRSQHESLIAVSNYEFYDNRLLIVPSPQQQSERLGLKLHYLPTTYYEPGTKRTNQLEAQLVAQAVIKHARETPDLTLGVAAFSQSQTQAVRDELERLRRQNIDCEFFFNRHPNEPFFVKNLENVQGDERDVILISVGYGKTKDGKLSMNFGPLNQEGGERRLNVLITRARYRCEVFTNLLGDDIDLTRSQARGVAALKRFLKYAETGDLGLALPSLREPGSPFEEAVAEKIKASGYNVHYQVGTAGFFIDLAIVDPDHPGNYLIGIECDGAQYHRSASARDRDRLRQAILESKGWIIHRIWSTDWFNNANRELEKTIRVIEEAKRQRNNHLRVAVSEPVSESRIIRREESNMPVEDTGNLLRLVPYQMMDEFVGQGWLNIDEVPTTYLQSLINRVVATEGPVHIDEVVRRVARGLGFGRAGAKIRETIESQIKVMNSIRRVGAFVQPIEQTTVTVRDRASLPNESRKIEYISPQEMQLVLKWIVESSYGIELDELARETCLKFGFSRVTQQMQEHVKQVINQMVSRKMLMEKNGLITIVQ